MARSRRFPSPQRLVLVTLTVLAIAATAAVLIRVARHHRALAHVRLKRGDVQFRHSTAVARFMKARLGRTVSQYFAEADVTLADPSVTDSDLSALEGLVLHRLALDRSSVTDQGLERVAGQLSLEFVSLQSCPNVSDAGMACLARLPRLKDLWLGGTSISDAGVERLSRSMSLESVGLRATDRGARSLAKIQTLKKLSLAGPSITNASLAALAAAGNLTELSLHDTRVTTREFELWRPPRLFNVSPCSTAKAARFHPRQSNG